MDTARHLTGVMAGGPAARRRSHPALLRRLRRGRALARHAGTQVVAVRILLRGRRGRDRAQDLRRQRAYGHRRADYGDFAYWAGSRKTTCCSCGQVRHRHNHPLRRPVPDGGRRAARPARLFDGIPDIYALNLNDQGEVTWALSKMLAMAKPTRPASSCSATRTRRHVRVHRLRRLGEQAARPALPRPGETNGEDEGDARKPPLNDPRRQLRRSKANLSAKDALRRHLERRRVRDRRPEAHDHVGAVRPASRETHAEAVFLEGLNRLTGSGGILRIRRRLRTGHQR